MAALQGLCQLRVQRGDADGLLALLHHYQEFVTGACAGGPLPLHLHRTLKICVMICI